MGLFLRRSRGTFIVKARGCSLPSSRLVRRDNLPPLACAERSLELLESYSGVVTSPYLCLGKTVPENKEFQSGSLVLSELVELNAATPHHCRWLVSVIIIAAIANWF